ncbi:MAG: HD domain-containing protein [Desulfovibrio sp.]|jgi:HD-GYP domain-containing protein (c-di-GMP phosphodiesterase class II)/phosphoribosyl 1,2-cyclic phosphodiesterase|nr:HD domain-containing protein [Desulfovibrio sp.]
MYFTLWGVRGSISNPRRETAHYGANTTCIEVRTNARDLLILDAGTGIRSLGRTLPNRGVLHLFLTHSHADHVQGLTFFAPLFQASWKAHIYVPVWMKEILPRIPFDCDAFPGSYDALASRPVVHHVDDGDVFVLEDTQTPVRIRTFATPHPGGGIAYRIEADNSIFVFSGDYELPDKPEKDAQARAMLEDADTAVVDAHFTRQDFVKGWGHSVWDAWTRLADLYNVGSLFLSHHAPDRTDRELDALQDEIRAACPGKRRYMAREGLTLPVSGAFDFVPLRSDWLDAFIDSLSRYKDESTLLDCLLGKMRSVTGADAGTFYLVEGDELVFAYSHNDTLFPGDSAHSSAYVATRLPTDTDSIVGWCAVTRQSLNIPDVYALPDNVPYHFNKGFDKKYCYRTRSVLTMPLLSRDGDRLLGVLQLINAADRINGGYRAFSEEQEKIVRILLREAAAFLEKSAATREGIYQLIRVAMLHDPMETGAHVDRVGAVTAELYHAWALKKKEDRDVIRYNKGRIRMASMLHDIGKVGISDLVLKKPGRLNDEERACMNNHTRLGASLFDGDAGDVGAMAYLIAMHHHQKWDGTGYPVENGAVLAGEDIPLPARLVAVVDVYDALVSRRCYKPPEGVEEAREILRRDAGSHFDPDIVDCFIEIADIVEMIYNRYPDEERR